MRSKSRKIGFNARLEEKLRRFKSLELSKYAGVLVILCCVGVYVLFRTMSPQHNAAQVRFVEAPGIESSEQKPDSDEHLKNPFSGNEFDQAVRLREAAALGMAVSLSVLSLNARTARTPSNVTEIFRNLTSSKLWPPGIEERNGVIVSEQSIFHIAYRREPVSFEVLAIPRSEQGSQLLFRFPLPQREPNSILYFEAKRDQAIPLALLTTEQLSTSGWRIRHWRGDALTLDATTVESLREQSSKLSAR